MNWEELFWKNEIQSNIKFDKEMKTVFDLSYFLIDFQAVVNNMSEIIYDDVTGKNRITEVIPVLNNEDIQERKLIENEHPKWQKEIEKNVESFLFQSPDMAVNYLPGTTTRLKQTTNRNYNRKYQMNLQLKSFSKGSLVLEVVNSLIVSLLTEFVKSVLVK